MTNLSRSMKVVLASVLVAATSGGACSLTPGSGSQDVGVVTVSLAETPSDASCLQLQFLGTTRQFPLVRGMRTVITMDDVPAQCFGIDARAFPATCDAVTTDSVATWLGSTFPCISPGFPANVTITMR